MPNKTISVPDDVLPVIDNLDIPFSQWVTELLRRHAAASSIPLVQQLRVDAEVASKHRLSADDAEAIGERMDRTAAGQPFGTWTSDVCHPPTRPATSLLR